MWQEELGVFRAGSCFAGLQIPVDAGPDVADYEPLFDQILLRIDPNPGVLAGAILLAPFVAFQVEDPFLLAPRAGILG